jgi:hypothetical protein
VSSEDFPQDLASDWRWLWDRLLGSSRIRRVLDSPSCIGISETPQQRVKMAGSAAGKKRVRSAAGNGKVVHCEKEV